MDPTYEPMLDYCGSFLQGRSASKVKKIVVIGKIEHEVHYPPHAAFKEYFTTALLVPIVQPLTRSKIIQVPSSMVEKYSDVVDKITIDSLLETLLYTVYNDMGYQTHPRGGSQLKSIDMVRSQIIAYAEGLIRRHPSYKSAIVRAKQLFATYQFNWLSDIIDRLSDELATFTYYYRKASKIKQCWKQAYTDPHYILCIERLKKEFDELGMIQSSVSG